jgi:hypothetical protein
LFYPALNVWEDPRNLDSTISRELAINPGQLHSMSKSTGRS